MSAERSSKWRKRQRGMSLIEIMVATGVLIVLASAVIPVARWDEKRRLENRLRVTLQVMRQAIDQYNKYMAEGLIMTTDVEQCALPADRSTCFPLTLDELVEGVEVGSPESPERKIIRFLPRIPVDPITGEAEWGMRSYQDPWDTDSWGGENVYDVYSLSEKRALDDTYYRDW
ncbi:MAG: type II secretion system protein [bacterium]|nr:type II secretion system protein [bacterium]